MNKFCTKDRKAFTLAEVLITLAIIGVVASMVVPALLQNTQNKETVTRLLKTFSTLDQAYRRFQMQGTDFDNLFAGNLDPLPSFNVFITEFAVMRSCGTSSIGCFPNILYKALDGSPGNNLEMQTNVAKAILNDGSLIAMFDYENNGCTYDIGTGPLSNSVCSQFLIDTNGSSPPNVYGRDAFVFHLTKNGIIPMGTFNDTTNVCNTNGDLHQSYGCTAKVIQEKAINY